MLTYLVGPYADVETLPTNCQAIGVDFGAYLLASHGIKMTKAIGDFDSVTEEQRRLIEQNSERTIILPTQKDETDLEAALSLLETSEEYVALGFLNGFRVDHLFQVFLLLNKYSQLNLRFVNSTNRCYTLKKGIHTLEKDGFRYLSLFALLPCTFHSLEGLRYPLPKVTLDAQSTYAISNEIIGRHGKIEVIDGVLLVIQSND